MDFNEYQELARRTRTEYENIDYMKANIGLGLAGESGEVADILKKDLSKSKAIDKEHLIEELGDVLWYIAEACDCFDVKMEEIAKYNIEKLKKRYPNGYSGYGIR